MSRQRSPLDEEHWQAFRDRPEPDPIDPADFADYRCSCRDPNEPNERDCPRHGEAPPR